MHSTLCFKKIKDKIILLFTGKDKTEKGLYMHSACTFIVPYVCRIVNNPFV